MSEHFQAIATLFSLVNPFVCAMIFSGIVAGQERASAVRTATTAIMIIALVLLIAAFVVSRILHTFGISLDAFSVAGGVVLMFIGFAMLRGSSSPSTPDTLAKQGAATSRLGPLVLFAASPGTITGVITIAAAHSRDKVPLTAVVAIGVVLAVTWVLLLVASGRKGTSAGPGLAREMASRYMGLIIIAMGIQFALGGYKAFMAG